ncbi:leukotriene A-4 hydrolase-like isoform X2 [Varroa jacobsoni]|uniref:Peptidase M1 membrane alanine aminopeptidase domain-containing protein n=1 Tax=Varroa destructor TaxID=109461 RepID=A0A7M7JJ98_VARDE|nr:leukotriene A-4 hydrolase-like isoform X2 [Varroa destructor]XP_022706338.1 leukotriene A-4 hydrolase-like isoform X2 [Varroa jacobsoni]
MGETIGYSADLHVEKVRLNRCRRTYFYKSPRHKIYGEALRIQIPKEETTFEVDIAYRTGNSSALRWNHRDERSVFTLSFPVAARSILPCQDVPQVKVPFCATLLTPRGTVAVMGASLRESGRAPDGRNMFHFEQPVPIPFFLIAFAVGDFSYVPVSSCVGAYTEDAPGDARFVAATVKRILPIAFDLLGPCIFSKFDVLILNDFPFKALEIPGLTFINASLVGSAELAVVLAHEVAHSWFGNSLGIETFHHLWITEGICSYIERRILLELRGEEFWTIVHRDAISRLEFEVRILGAKNPRLKLVNPDVEASQLHSVIPYEKGYLFLVYLEQLVGVEKLLCALRCLHLIYKETAINSEKIREFFTRLFEEKIAEVNWDEWLYEPGLPRIARLNNNYKNIKCQARTHSAIRLTPS